MQGLQWACSCMLLPCLASKLGVSAFEVCKECIVLASVIVLHWIGPLCPRLELNASLRVAFLGCTILHDTRVQSFMLIPFPAPVCSLIRPCILPLEPSFQDNHRRIPDKQMLSLDDRCVLQVLRSGAVHHEHADPECAPSSRGGSTVPSPVADESAGPLRCVQCGADHATDGEALL
jgi:hypothetical protein